MCVTEREFDEALETEPVSRLLKLLLSLLEEIAHFFCDFLLQVSVYLGHKMIVEV